MLSRTLHVAVPPISHPRLRQRLRSSGVSLPEALRQKTASTQSLVLVFLQMKQDPPSPSARAPSALSPAKSAVTMIAIPCMSVPFPIATLAEPDPSRETT
jgi:hypothetical protein